MFSGVKFVKDADVPKRTAKPQVDPMVSAREKLVAAIELQKSAVEAEKAGKPFTPPAKEHYKKVNGERVKVTEPVKLKLWHWKVADTYYTSIKYGVNALPCGPKGETVLMLDAIGDLLKVYDQAVTAAKTGKMDKLFQPFVNKGPREKKSK